MIFSHKLPLIQNIMLKHSSVLRQPLLDTTEINECMLAGNHWNGNGLPWALRGQLRDIQQGTSGDLTSQRHGNGIDFSEIRPYQTGDEPRYINWRATARAGRPMVRVFHEDLTPQSYYLIDRRASMRFGTRTRLKVTQAARLAIFLASWEAQKGAELGSLILNQTPQWHSPLSGPQGVYQLAQNVSRSCVPLPATLKQVATLSMKRALSILIEHIPLGSHVYLISDFYDLEDDILPELYQLGQQQCVWALGVYDAAEQKLPDAGKLQLMWGEDKIQGNCQLTNANDPVVQSQYQLAFMKKQLHIKSIFEKAGINFNVISSVENDLSTALMGAVL